MVSGVGKAKFEKYGEAFLSAIGKYLVYHPDVKKSNNVQVKNTLKAKKLEKKTYSDWAKEYPNTVIVKKEGAFFTVRGESARMLGNISDFNLSNGKNPVSGSPKLERVTKYLIAKEINYIVVINNEITEERRYENNHYDDYKN